MRTFHDPDQEAAYILGLPVAAETRPGTPQMMGGAYEAASQFDRSLATWHPAIQSADADILPDKDLTDARAIDMTRNDAFALSGVSLHRDNIVGSQFMLNSKPKLKALGMDETWGTEFSEEVEAKFSLWAESFNNWPDAARRNTLTSMVRLAVGVYLKGGELLATAEWSRDTDRPYRTAIQMIALDRLSNPSDQVYDMERTRGGVRLNAAGAPLGYYIRNASRGGMWDWKQSVSWSYVRARNSFGRPQVIHIMEQDRPGQTRGVSQLSAALKEMRITKRFRDITLQNAVVNASFAAAIESELPSAQVFEALGGGDVGSSIVNYAQQFLGAISAYAGNARNMQIDGVKIPHLMPGTKLNMLPMGNPGGVGGEFEQSLLRYLAADLGVSYEQLSKDYSETNYSSARAGMTETWKFMQSRKRMVADRFATMVFRLWFEEAVNMGEITAMNARSVPNMYDGLNMEAFCECDWIGASRGQIDELKETQAAILRIKNRLSTYEEEIGRMGKDWRPMFQQIAREQGVMKELEIETEETNAMNAVSGETREAGDGTVDDTASDERKKDV
jgi:lambda family phage portal protein